MTDGRTTDGTTTDVPEGPPYPAHWEADAVLTDGRTVHVRPIRPDDRERLVGLHSRLSPESIYFRFFAPYPVLSDRDVERFTHVDHHDRVALVALLGDDIIGVVRFDRVGGEEAEVAFNVEDAHQGRGLGPLLLEHCAAAARERGVRRFVADVLPANQRMITVFQAAGYRVRHGFEDGVVRLVLDLEPTETSVEVTRAREHRAEARSVERLLRAGSVVVVGAGRRHASVGRRVLANIRAGGFAGPLHAVNLHADTPDGNDVDGVPAYGSVVDVPGTVDLAVVAVPAEAVQQVVLDCARKGVRGLLVMSAGYAETGPEGRERQRRLVATARANGMRILGPNSFGMINTADDVRLNASLAPGMPIAGRVGFFSQSGALGIAVLDAVTTRGLGLSTFVSAGNRADLSGNDLLQYWQDDPGTDVVLLYLESIGNPRKFSRIARRVGRSKPVVAVKTGQSTQGVPLGHAVQASTMPATAWEAMFAQAGVIRVDTISQMFDVAKVLAGQPLPPGPRVAVVGNSDSLALLAADSCQQTGLQLVGQPVVLSSDSEVADLRAAVAAALADPGVDSLVAAFAPSPLLDMRVGDPELARMLAEESAGSGKTVVATFLGIQSVQARPDGTSVPSYPSPEMAVRSLAAASRYAAWRREPPGERPELGPVDVGTAHALVDEVLAGTPQGRDLTVDELTRLLACYGVETWPTVDAPTVEAAVRAAEEVGYPVALKTTVEALRHRPELDGVRLNLHDEQALRRAYAAMTATLPAAAARSLVLQRMAPPGVVVVMTAMEDLLFGPVVSFGVGGVASELLGDRAYRIPPITDLDAARMIREVKAAPLLLGYRGAEPVDVPAVEDLLARVARLSEDLPEVALLELNPVLAGTRGVAVLGAHGRVAPPRTRSDRGPRALSR